MSALLATLCCNIPNITPVKSILRRLNSDSESYLVTAEDGSLFVLKVFPPDMAALYARREIFAHAIGVRLGFSMAHWTTLQLDGQTLARYRNVLEAAACGSLAEGIYYGSRVVTGPGAFVDTLSLAQASKNIEIARQLGCIRMFHVWAAHTGRTEYAALFERGRPTHIYFFSHRQLLNPETSADAQRRACLAYAEACREAGHAGYVDAFLRGLGSLTAAELYNAFRTVPAFWRNPSDESSSIRLLELRRDWLRALARSGFRTFDLSLSTQAVCDTTCSHARKLPV